MIFQREMNIFRMVSYNSLGFGALILGSNSLLIIKTFFTDVIYKLFQYFQYFSIFWYFNLRKQFIADYQDLFYRCYI